MTAISNSCLISPAPSIMSVHLNLFLYHLMEFSRPRYFCCVSLFFRIAHFRINDIVIAADLLAPTNGSFTPSAVTRIDGEDVKDLTRYGSGMQDLDALYNSALTSPAIWGYNGGYGTLKIGPFTQHRDTTLYTFENGSTTEDTATAQLDSLQAKSFPGSGLELFDLITSTVTNTSASSSSASPTSSSLPSSTPLGSTYPSPIVQHSENFISGFFLNETENNDVAVLNAASFFVHGPSDRDEFLQKSAVFLAKCRSAGKTRLIVDVRNNPGGMVILGFALFSQLFPDIIPYSGIRFRASDATNEIGQIASANLTQSIDEIIPNGFEFAYQDLLQTPNGLNYTSWQQLYGPVQQHGDLYSQLAAWRFGSPDYYSSLSHLYYDGASIPPQVFASADITLVSLFVISLQSRRPLLIVESKLTDGQCSSTCAIFANLMINQGHVKTVTMGGRPNNQPMAIIGGVQGAQVEEADFLQLAASAAIEAQAEAKGNSSVEASRTQKLLGSLALPPPIAAAPSGVSVNLLDNIAENDTSVTPLQFTGGIASNCRTYYTLPDFVNSANTWARVARGGKAGGSGLCINGTLTNTTVSLGNSSGSNSTPPGGSNGNNALTFQGDASNTQFSKLGCSILVITVGLFSTLIL